MGQATCSTFSYISYSSYWKIRRVSKTKVNLDILKIFENPIPRDSIYN